MSNDIVKIRLQYNNKTTSVELDASRSVESIKPFLRALWEAMYEPPIRLVQTPQACIDPDFLRSPETLDNMEKVACPLDRTDHNNCPNYTNGKCILGRGTSELFAVAPKCPVATDKPETNS